MNKVRLTKKFTFEMAHALHNYEGDCRNIHGHSYTLEVCIKGITREQIHHPEDGFLLDFGVLKRIVNTAVIDKFDHSLVLSHTTPHETLELLRSQYSKTVVSDYNPTCENLVADFADRVTQELPAEVTLHHLILHETATAYCEWYAEDQEQ